MGSIGDMGAVSVGSNRSAHGLALDWRDPWFGYIRPRFLTSNRRTDERVATTLRVTVVFCVDGHDSCFFGACWQYDDTIIDKTFDPSRPFFLRLLWFFSGQPP
jgi:hypothetical protein